jgi:hypothetical protein
MFLSNDSPVPLRYPVPVRFPGGAPSIPGASLNVALVTPGGWTYEGRSVVLRLTKKNDPGSMLLRNSKENGLISTNGGTSWIGTKTIV